MSCGLARVGRGDASVGAILVRLTLAVEHDADRDRREDDHRDQDRHDRRGATAAAVRSIGARLGSAEILGAADAAFGPATGAAGRLAAVTTATRGRISSRFLRSAFPLRLLLSSRPFRPFGSFRAGTAGFLRGGTFGGRIVSRRVMGSRIPRAVPLRGGFVRHRGNFGFVDGFARTRESARGN